jgi:hypothetical protein
MMKADRGAGYCWRGSTTSSASPKMDGAGLAATALTEFGRWRPYLVPGLPMDMLKLIAFVEAYLACSY